MAFFDWLVIYGAWIGMWVWVVRSRGSMNVWLANLAGFVGGLIVAMVVELLTRSAEEVKAPDAQFMLFSIMAGLGTLVGMWMWLIARLKQPENLFLRHLFAGSVGFFTGSAALVTTWSFFVPG